MFSKDDDITNKLPLSYITPDKQKLNFQYQKGLMNYKLRLSGFKVISPLTNEKLSGRLKN